MKEELKITWLGHSCFKVEYGDFAVVLDPFEPGSVPGYRDISETASLVLCSHGHFDHNYVKGVKIVEKKNPFKITELRTFHDAVNGAERGENTIHILESESFRVAHLGDLGCPLTREQQKKLMNLDAVFVPVGGHYTIGPREAKDIVDGIMPKVTIPMHFRGNDFGFQVLGTEEDYLHLCGNVVRYDTDSFVLDSKTPCQTAVLRYCR